MLTTKERRIPTSHVELLKSLRDSAHNSQLQSLHNNRRELQNGVMKRSTCAFNPLQNATL